MNLTKFFFVLKNQAQDGLHGSRTDTPNPFNGDIRIDSDTNPTPANTHYAPHQVNHGLFMCVLLTVCFLYRLFQLWLR